MAPGELTPGDASCVESHSWVLVLPSQPPERWAHFSSLTCQHLRWPLPQWSPGLPHVFIFKTQRYVKPSARQHEIPDRAASLEERRSLPTSPHGGSIPFSPPARGDKGTGKEKDVLLRRTTLGIR